MIEYPYFSDIRSDGLNQENPITANLSQVTMAWSSPITIDQEKHKNHKVIELLNSSEKSWLSDNTMIMPEINEQGMTLFKREGELSQHLLGVITQGEFSSYFAGKPSPLSEGYDLHPDSLLGNETSTESALDDGSPDTQEDESSSATATVFNVIEKSPASARIVLFSSNDFLRDQVLTIANSAVGSEYRSSLELIANTVDWSLEDSGLLSIRSRGHFNRTLPPMEHDTQLFWEYLNYGLVVAALAIIALIRRRRYKSRQRRYLTQLANQGGAHNEKANILANKPIAHSTLTCCSPAMEQPKRSTTKPTKTIAQYRLASC